MNIVLGFGSTETDFERTEEQVIRAHIENRYLDLSLDYFTDEFVAEIGAWLNDRAEHLHAQSKAYKTATDFPSRYSEYWPSVIADASRIVVILSIHHINRRHAMSPDGWALLQSEPIFLFKSYDMPRAEKVA